MRTLKLRFNALLAACAFAVGCNVPVNDLFGAAPLDVDAGTQDVDSGVDAGSDAGFDAGFDAGQPKPPVVLPDYATCAQGATTYRARPAACGPSGRCLVTQVGGGQPTAIASPSLNGVNPVHILGANNDWAMAVNRLSDGGSVLVAIRTGVNSAPWTAEIVTSTLKWPPNEFAPVEPLPTTPRRKAISYWTVETGEFPAVENFSTGTMALSPFSTGNMWAGGSGARPAVQIFDPDTVHPSSVSVVGALVTLTSMSLTALSPTSAVPFEIFDFKKSGSVLAANEYPVAFAFSPTDGTLAFITRLNQAGGGTTLWLRRPGTAADIKVGTYPWSSEFSTLMQWDRSGTRMFIANYAAVRAVDAATGIVDTVLQPAATDNAQIADTHLSVVTGGFVVRMRCMASALNAGTANVFVDLYSRTARLVHGMPGFPDQLQFKGDFSNNGYGVTGTFARIDGVAYWLAP